MELIVDIEANALDPNDVTHIWCIVVKNVETGEVNAFTEEDIKEGKAWHLLSAATRIIGHSFINYDYRVIESLYPGKINPAVVYDTLIASKLLRFRPLDGEGQSLEAWGTRFGQPKYSSPDTFSEYTPYMLEYCKQDVEINHSLYAYLQSHLDTPDFRKAVETEMIMGWVCLDMELNGFAFDIDKANELLKELEERLVEIDKEIVFPKVVKPGKEYTPKATKYGTISKTSVPRSWSDLSRLCVGCPFTTVSFDDFNPASYNQLTKYLDKAGWKPYVKTNTGNGWKINEDNLSTLPDSAPEGARKLVERLMIAARVRTLKEWKSYYNSNTGRVHGKFASIGTWTGRMAHSNPNLGNVSAKKSIKYKGEHLRELALRYGASMRNLWIAGPDTWLVGTDMEAAHVRLFAHYIDDLEFTKAVVSGDKKKGTDVHSLGAKIFRSLGCDRDQHKTFIFSFFNGAGKNKVGEIFGCSLGEAARALELYQERYPGLARLKQEIIPKYAEQGWFPGLDGRRVYCDDEHLMFAGMLQNGESIIMKMATISARKRMMKEGISFKTINVVHDEVIHEIYGTEEEARQAGEIQAEAIKLAGQILNLRCPLAGEFKVGKDWLIVH